MSRNSWKTFQSRERKEAKKFSKIWILTLNKFAWVEVVHEGIFACLARLVIEL